MCRSDAEGKACRNLCTSSAVSITMALIALAALITMAASKHPKLRLHPVLFTYPHEQAGVLLAHWLFNCSAFYQHKCGPELESFGSQPNIC